MSNTGRSDMRAHVLVPAVEMCWMVDGDACSIPVLVSQRYVWGWVSAYCLFRLGVNAVWECCAAAASVYAAVVMRRGSHYGLNK